MIEKPISCEGWEQLDDALLADRGLQAIVDTASRLLGNPCFVGDSRFKVLAMTVVPDIDDDAWRGMQQHGYASLGGMRELDDLGVSERVRIGRGPQHIEFPSSRYQWVTTAIGLDSAHLAYFGTILSNCPLDDRRLQLFSYASRIIACELRNARYESDSLRSAREHFLFEAVTDASMSPERLYDLMARARVKDEGPYQLMVIRDSCERPNIPDTVRFKLEGISSAGFSVMLQGDVVIALSGRLVRGFKGERSDLFEAALRESGLICGMCPVFDSIHEMARRCREAKVTADLDVGLNLDIPLLSFEDPRVYPFSAVLAGHFSMSSFIHPQLRRLEEYDESKGTELVATLEAYMRNNYNIAQTARDFFTHRNTIDYRLKRIEELIGAPLSDPNVNMALWLSLQARKLEQSGVRTLDD